MKKLILALAVSMFSLAAAASGSCNNMKLTDSLSSGSTSVKQGVSQ